MNPVVKRTVSALSVAALVVALLLYVPFKFLLPAIIALVALVHLEFMQLAARKYDVAVWSSVAAGVAFLCGVFYAHLNPVWTLAALFFVLAVATLFDAKRTRPLETLGVTALGLVYIPVMLSFFILTGATSVLLLFYLVSIVKISDMGGFAFGLAFGKHKMCPAISPKKSWEGLAGSVFGSCLISCCFIHWTHFGWACSLAFGITAALVGTLGDLVESRFKREVDVKDSATFMPAGMGGFLDMFDSLVFVPAVLYPFLLKASL